MKACATAGEIGGAGSPRRSEEAFDEGLHQDGDIFAPLAKRRKRERQHIEAVIQILAELPVRHHLLEVPLACPRAHGR